MLNYSKKLEPKSSVGPFHKADRRRSERFCVNNAFAECRKKGILASRRWHRVSIKDVSEHGFLITSRVDTQHGEVWEVIVNLVVYDEPIRTTTKVVRVKKEHTTLEIALDIIKINESDRKKLSKSSYLNRLFLYAGGARTLRP